MHISKLVIASHNAGKVKEIGELLAPFSVEVISAATLNLPEPAETGTTFIANAAIKSESAAKLSGLWALSDDSGLCVHGLNDAPGVYSADWAGPGKDFKPAMERIHDELKEKGINPQGAEAYFVCVLSLTSPDMRTIPFEGRVEGTLTFPPRGAKGFGYDPIYIPSGYTMTFAEMDPAKKHEMSHRAKAFAKFIDYVQKTKVKEAM